MAEHAPGPPNHHVLLIGIDDYPVFPLRGSVNDLDEMQRVLLDTRSGIRPDRIQRLASPVPGRPHDTTIPQQPATLDNLRAAFARLGSDEVRPGDRVFIYYSGHGKSVAVSDDDGRVYHREALIPTDYTHGRFLFDFELNELLAAIVARTTSVAVVLDCCHASGVSRSVNYRTIFDDAPSGPGIRGAIPLRATTRGARGLTGAEVQRGLCEGIDACHVVSACLGNELAFEGEYDRVYRGRLTHALVSAIRAAGNVDLRELTWAQIWNSVRAHVRRHAPQQHPEIAGSLARAVLAGPPVDADPGIPVTYDAHRDRYLVAAGEMAEITPGAVLAVYGSDTRRFPPRDSPADREQRLGLLRVESAALATAIAVAAEIETGTVFPDGARARLLAAGEASRLYYAVTPGHPELQIESRLLAPAPPGQSPDVRLELVDGRWRLLDDEHTLAPGAAVLFELGPAQIHHATALLEHYHRYSMPLRIAQRAARGPKGELQLAVLRCPDRRLTPEESQRGTSLTEAAGRGRYAVTTGAHVCFRVANTGPRPMRVSLVNVAASGRVQWLGDQVVGAGRAHIFWSGNRVGTPFWMKPGNGRSCGIDRLVAIGRTDVSIELEHLTLDARFTDVVLTLRGGAKDMDGPEAPDDQLDAWAAAIAVIETRDPPAAWHGAPGPRSA